MTVENTASQMVEESRRREDQLTHRRYHHNPHHCIDFDKDPLPLCKAFNCFAPMVGVSQLVQGRRVTKQLEDRLARTVKELEAAQAKAERRGNNLSNARQKIADYEKALEAAKDMAADPRGIITTQARAVLTERDGKPRWHVEGMSDNAILNKIKELEAQNAKLQKKTDNQAKQITNLLAKKKGAEAKIQTLVAMPSQAKKEHLRDLPVDNPSERDRLAGSYIARLGTININQESPIAVATNAYHFADKVLQEKETDGPND